MPPTTRKPTHVRRREIAESALRVIGAQGATSLTAATLAAEVGVTPGALFRHFATVDDILDAAVDVAIEAVETTFPAKDLPPVERLRALALARVALVGQTPGIGWLLLSDQVYLTVPDAAVARLRRLVQRSRAFLIAALEEGVAQGDLRSDLSPETMLPIFTGTVHSLIAGRGMHRTRRARAGAPSPEQVVDALLALLATH